MHCHKGLVNSNYHTFKLSLLRRKNQNQFQFLKLRSLKWDMKINRIYRIFDSKFQRGHIKKPTSTPMRYVNQQCDILLSGET